MKLLNIQKLTKMAKDPPPDEDLALTVRSITAKIGNVRVDLDTFMVGFYTALLPSDLFDLRLIGLTSTKQWTLNEAAEVVTNELDQKTYKQTVAAQIKRRQRNRQKTNSSAESSPLFFYCAKINHTVEKCFTKKKAVALKQNSAEKTVDKFKESAIAHKVCGVMERPTKGEWWLDSGTQTHLTNNNEGFVALRETTNFTLESTGGDDVVVESAGIHHVRSRPDMILELSSKN